MVHLKDLNELFQEMVQSYYLWDIEGRNVKNLAESPPKIPKLVIITY